MRNLVKVCLALLSTVSACSVLAASAPHYKVGLQSSSRDYYPFNIINYTNQQFVLRNISQTDAYNNQTYFDNMVLSYANNSPYDNIEFDFSWPDVVKACFEVDNYNSRTALIPYYCYDYTSYSNCQINIQYDPVTHKPEASITC